MPLVNLVLRKGIGTLKVPLLQLPVDALQLSMLVSTQVLSKPEPQLFYLRKQSNTPLKAIAQAMGVDVRQYQNIEF